MQADFADNLKLQNFQSKPVMVLSQVEITILGRCPPLKGVGG